MVNFFFLFQLFFPLCILTMYAEGSSRSSYNTFQDAQEPAHSHNHSHGGSPWKEEHLSVSGRMGEILGGIVDGAVCSLVTLNSFCSSPRKQSWGVGGDHLTVLPFF